MDLKGLAGGGAHGAIAQPVRELINRQIQGRWDAATGAAQPQHHLPILFRTLAAVIAVVLLVAAVEFENLNGPFREIGVAVCQLTQQWFLEMATTCFELFKLRGSTRSSLVSLELTNGCRGVPRAHRSPKRTIGIDRSEEGRSIQ